MKWYRFEECSKVRIGEGIPLHDVAVEGVPQRTLCRIVVAGRVTHACVDPVMADGVGPDTTAQHFRPAVECCPRGNVVTATQMREGEVIEHLNRVRPPPSAIVQRQGALQRAY